MEVYVYCDIEGIFYVFLELNMFFVGEIYYCVMVDYNYGYNGCLGLLDYVLGGNMCGECYSEVKLFCFLGLLRLVVYDVYFIGYSFYLFVEVCFKSNGGIIEQGVCYSFIKRIFMVDDQKILVWEIWNYDYLFLEVEVIDLFFNIYYYICFYVIIEEGIGYGLVVEFIIELGMELIIDYFMMYIDIDRLVNLYVIFYIDNYQIMYYGYSYGIYFLEMGMVMDEQKIEVLFEDNYG